MDIYIGAKFQHAKMSIKDKSVQTRGNVSLMVWWSTYITETEIISI